MGQLMRGEYPLAEFYSAHQHADENVSSWGCRVEDLYYKAFKTSVNKHLQEFTFSFLGWVTTVDQKL